MSSTSNGEPCASPKTCASVLDFVDWHLAHTSGVSPTFTEIMDGCGIGSKSTVGHALDTLEEGGFIRRVRSGEGKRIQCISVVEPRHVLTGPIGAIYAACGGPVGRIGGGEARAA